MKKRAGVRAGAERQMNLATMSELALVRWHGFREFRHMSQSQTILLVLVVFAGLALIVWAVQRRRRRWF